MNCRKAEILISASLDGELTDKELLRLRRHIASCTACAHQQASLPEVVSAMHVWEDAEPSAWLAQSFAYKLREMEGAPQTAKPRRSWWLLGSAAAGLVTTALAFLVLTYYQPGPSDYDISPSPAQHINAPTKPAQSAPAVSEPVVPAKPETAALSQQPAVESESQAAVVPQQHERSIHANYAPKHKYGLAYSRSNSRQRLGRNRRVQLSSRGYSNRRRRAEEERAREFLMSTLLKTGMTTKGPRSSMVTGNLSNAGADVDYTIERIRGALRKAADVIQEDTPSAPEKPLVDMHEGKGL